MLLYCSISYGMQANSFTFPGGNRHDEAECFVSLPLCTLTLLSASQLTCCPWERSSHFTLQKWTYKGSSL